MAGTTAEVNICPVCTIIVATVGAAEVVDGLSGEAFRGESGAADDDLAVGIGVAGVGCFVARHGANEIVNSYVREIYTRWGEGVLVV